MQLLEMIRGYQELLEKKESLDEETKANNKAIEEAKNSISQQMIDDDCPVISYDGYRFSLKNKTIYSKKSEGDLMAAGLDFLEVLREQGYGDLIKETVNSRTLSSAMAEAVDENGDLPEELAQVINSYDTFDILRRSETNKALKKKEES